MTTAARPSMLPPGRPWPPAVAASSPASGAVEISDHLVHDAELRMQPDGARGVLDVSLSTGRGHNYVARLAIAGDSRSLQDAAALARSLRRGQLARVRAHGCLPRNDHGPAVLQLLDVESVAPLQEEA